MDVFSRTRSIRRGFLRSRDLFWLLVLFLFSSGGRRKERAQSLGLPATQGQLPTPLTPAPPRPPDPYPGGTCRPRADPISHGRKEACEVPKLQRSLHTHFLGQGARPTAPWTRGCQGQQGNDHRATNAHQEQAGGRVTREARGPGHGTQDPILSTTALSALTSKPKTEKISRTKPTSFPLSWDLVKVTWLLCASKMRPSDSSFTGSGGDVITADRRLNHTGHVLTSGFLSRGSATSLPGPRGLNSIMWNRGYREGALKNYPRISDCVEALLPQPLHCSRVLTASQEPQYWDPLRNCTSLPSSLSVFFSFYTQSKICNYFPPVRQGRYLLPCPLFTKQIYLRW